METFTNLGVVVPSNTFCSDVIKEVGLKMYFLENSMTLKWKFPQCALIPQGLCTPIIIKISGD